MKKLIILLLPLLIIFGCSKPIHDDTLVERNGIHYQVNSETPYSGKSFSLHDNGQKYYERTYKDGKQDGLYTEWAENGWKRFEVTYKDGEIISDKVVWNEDGSLNIPVDFKTLIEKDGLLYEVNSKTPYNGQIFFIHEEGLKGYFKDGKPDGLMTYLDKNDGKIYKGNYINVDDKNVDWSSLNGSYFAYYKNNLRYVSFKNGEQDGIHRGWYKNGQKEAEGTFKDGRPDGLIRRWYENGQKEEEGTYKDGEMISEKYWKEDGSVDVRESILVRKIK